MLSRNILSVVSQDIVRLISWPPINVEQKKATPDEQAWRWVCSKWIEISRRGASAMGDQGEAEAAQ